MKRFFCAAFFVVVVALLAACGALNTSSAAAQATATPTSSTSRTQKSDSTVKVNETAAKVEVVTAQSSATPSATAAPAPAETPATGDFPVMYLAGVVGLILICSAGLLMLRNLSCERPAGRFFVFRKEVVRPLASLWEVKLSKNSCRGEHCSPAPVCLVNKLSRKMRCCGKLTGDQWSPLHTQ